MNLSKAIFGKKEIKDKKFKIKVKLAYTKEDENGKKFDFKFHELDVNSNMQLIEVINQLEKVFNISFRENELQTEEKILTEDCDNKLLGSLFKNISDDNPVKLFIYPKGFYHIKIEFEKKYVYLIIKDTTLISKICERAKKLLELYDNNYQIIVNGKLVDLSKSASFYNLKESKAIMIHLVLWG